MANNILLLNTKVEIQKTLGVAKTITAISKASEALITATHDFAVGDLILLDAIGGMVELNNRVVRVKTVNTTVSFVAEAIDSTNFSTFTSGGTATKITAFDTFDNVTGFSFPEPQPNKIDSTTIHDTVKQEVYGLDEAASITFSIKADPLNTAVANVRAASLAKSSRAFRVTLQTGNVLIFNSFVAGGRGLDGSAGALGTGQVFATLRAVEQWFTV